MLKGGKYFLGGRWGAVWFSDQTIDPCSKVWDIPRRKQELRSRTSGRTPRVTLPGEPVPRSPTLDLQVTRLRQAIIATHSWVYSGYLYSHGCDCPEDYLLYPSVYIVSILYCNRQRDEGVRGPWGKWGHHEWGGRRGTRPAWREGISSWYPAVETDRRSQDARRQRRQARRDIKASPCKEYVSLYVLICCNLNDCNREQCLTCLSVSGE